MRKQKSKKQEGKDLTLEDLYNLLMYDIEPDLMSERIPHLDAIYAGESAEERKARGERYAAAFEEFTLRFSVLMEAWKSALLTFKDAALKQFKQEAAVEDAAKLSEIEQSFDNA